VFIHLFFSMTNTYEFKELVDAYLQSKFTQDVFDPCSAAIGLSYVIKGVKAPMWFRVIKVELEHLAAAHNYFLIVLVEKPSNNFIQFRFEALPVNSLRRVSKEPPLSDLELRRVREILRRESCQSKD